MTAKANSYTSRRELSCSECHALHWKLKCVDLEQVTLQMPRQGTADVCQSHPDQHATHNELQIPDWSPGKSHNSTWLDPGVRLDGWCENIPWLYHNPGGALQCIVPGTRRQLGPGFVHTAMQPQNSLQGLTYSANSWDTLRGKSLLACSCPWQVRYDKLDGMIAMV